VRTLGATALAALAQGYRRVGYAVRIGLRSGTVWTVTDYPTGVTIDSEPYSTASLAVLRLPAEANPNLWQAQIRLGDGAGTYRAAIRSGAIARATAKVFVLLAPDAATTPEAVLVFSGIVEAPTVSGPSVKLTLGPAGGLWTVEGPPIFSATCTYPQERNVAVCAFADTCGGTWAECQANAQTELFNGRRRLPAAGVVVQIREDGVVTLGSRGE